MHRFRFPLVFAIVLSGTLVCAVSQQIARANESAEILWRNLGPASFGGHVNALAVPLPKSSADPAAGTIIYAGAPGGLFKSSDAGVTWESLFDAQPVAAVNAVAVAPTSPNIVWAGTGSADIYHMGVLGNGVYKSTDAGKTWTNAGLTATQFIGKILIHPADANTVFVGAIGPLGAPSHARGVFRSQDGGQTWQQTLYINDRTGIVDIAMAPDNPNILYASAEQIAVAPWVEMYLDYGPGSGIYKSSDAGKTWRRLKVGLPQAMFGYCSIGVSAAQPNVVYALMNEVTPASPQAAKRTKSIALYRSDDYGETWHVVALPKRLAAKSVYYRNDLGRIAVDPTNVDRVFITSLPVFVSTDGGRHFKKTDAPEKRTYLTYALGPASISADQHALWVDPADPQHLIAGDDHGVFISRSGGATWRHVETLNLQQYFSVAVDRRLPFYHIFGSMRDNNGYGGPNRSRLVNGIGNDEWQPTPAAESFGTAADQVDNRTIYVGTSNGLARFDSVARESVAVGPFPPYGQHMYPFNINGPAIISPLDHRTIFTGSRNVWESNDRGDHWRALSEPLSPKHSRILSIGGVREDIFEYGGLLDGGETPTTITTIAQSAGDARRLYAGTQDGVLAFTRDGGVHWRSIRHMPGTPTNSVVSRIVASNKYPGRAYVAYQAVNTANYRPYLFRTDDGGAHWSSMTAGLPDTAAVFALVEHFRNPDLLFAGTEVGVFYSIDAGMHWQSLRLNMPAAWVRDLVVQPDTNDLVAASWGRGLYVLDDISRFEHLAEARQARQPILFPAHFAVAFRQQVMGPDETAIFGEQNPPYGMLLNYYVPAGYKVNKSNSIVIEDSGGQTITRIPLQASSGAHRAVWDLRYPAPFSSGPPGPRALEGLYHARISAVYNEGRRVDFSVIPDTSERLDAVGRAALFGSLMRAYRLVQLAGATSDDAKRLLARVKVLQKKATPQGAKPNPKAPEAMLAARISKVLASIGGFISEGVDSSAAPSVMQVLLTVSFDEEYYPRMPDGVREQLMASAARKLREQIRLLRDIRANSLPALLRSSRAGQR